MKKTHTKGKWETAGVARKDVLDPAFYHVDIICNETIRVAKSSGVGEENALANARLIALAPNSLKVCEELVSFCESKERLNADDVCPTKAYELAKVVIAQA